MDLREPKPAIGELSLKRMVRVVEGVRSRLLRAAKALEDSKVAYAVAGGNAVGAWVARVDDIVNAVFSGEKVGPEHLMRFPMSPTPGRHPSFAC